MGRGMGSDLCVSPSHRSDLRGGGAEPGAMATGCSTASFKGQPRCWSCSEIVRTGNTQLFFLSVSLFFHILFVLFLNEPA